MKIGIPSGMRASITNNVVIGTGQEVVVDRGTDNILKNVILQPSQAESSRMAIQGAETQSPAYPKTPPFSGWK